MRVTLLQICRIALVALDAAQQPCAQMNFFGITSSGTVPNSLRNGPFSRLTFMQSPKQGLFFPTSTSYSTWKGKNFSPPHAFQHESDVCLIYQANFIDLKECSISARSASSSSVVNSAAPANLSSILIVKFIYYYNKC